MGLDMTIYGEKRCSHQKRAEDGYRVNTVILTLVEWRRHYDLNNFINDTFYRVNHRVWPEIDLDLEDIRYIMKTFKGKKDTKSFNEVITWVNDVKPNESRSIFYDHC